MTWQEQWLHQPQTLWFRRIIFQFHLWSGLAVGLYIVAISISGSILVYRVSCVKRMNHSLTSSLFGRTFN
ncbi:MAG: hypothetical protein Ct9H300mP25_07870 [Acidobacteriota bacterium]|nr:MAG: hypothetical protein Ct9H300mP25_07870 [Acidobacteriota bacterium]